VRVDVDNCRDSIIVDFDPCYSIFDHGEQKYSARFRKFFPPEYSLKEIEVVIIELVTDWKAKIKK